MDCVGPDTYDSALTGQSYAFRLNTHDHTANQASAEDATGTSRVTRYYYAGGTLTCLKSQITVQSQSQPGSTRITWRLRTT